MQLGLEIRQRKGVIFGANMGAQLLPIWDFLLLGIPISRCSEVVAWFILKTAGASGGQGV